MRDPNRIYPICMALAQAWSYAPDLRLMQMMDFLEDVLHYGMHSNVDPFYVEDDVWLKALKLIDQIEQNNNNMRKESDNYGNA